MMADNQEIYIMIDTKCEQSGSESDDEYEELPPLDDTSNETFSDHLPVENDIDYLSLHASLTQTGNSIQTAKTHQYKCDFCQKCFRKLYSLQRHMTTHGFSQVRVNKEKKMGIETLNNIPKMYNDKVAYENTNEFSKVCEICSRYFPSAAQKKVHKRDHHDVCDLCNIRLPSCTALKQHLKTHAIGTIQICHICNRGFRDSGKLKIHLQSENSHRCNSIKQMLEEQFNADYGYHLRCPYCTLNFMNMEACSKHVSTHYTEGQFTCDQCPLQFEEHYALLEHLLTHSESGLAQCDVCKAEFSYPIMQAHKTCHKKFYWCSLCGKIFIAMHMLVVHLNDHLNENEYICKLCKRSFTSRKNLKRHKKIHEVQRELLKCKHCSKVYYRPASLLAHEREKHLKIDDGKKLSCKYCNKKFVTKRNLKDHMKKHLMPYSFKCSFCPKTFKTRSCAEKHETIHNGQSTNIYKCQICEKSFRSAGSLQSHTLVHSNIRPHKCTICGKSFKTPTHLSYHMHIHTGERPYVCNVCGCGFTNQTHRKTHMRIHTGETPFKCSQCEAAYPTKAQLQRHVLKHE